MKHDFEKLYNKWLKQTCSPAEAERLLLYFRSGNMDSYLQDAIDKTLNAPPPDLSAEDLESIENNRIYLSKRIVERRSWTWLLSAAATIAVIAFIWWAYEKPMKATLLVNKKVDALPGINQAILTTADGHEIRLKNTRQGIRIDTGSVAYADGSRLINTHAGGMMSLRTPRGGQYQVMLPDGTKVWLNAASLLRYPSQFNDARREVFLEGEAFFEVSAKNGRTPFIVRSGDQEVEVLGTSFNISSYDEEGVIKTTLQSGSIKVGCRCGDTKSVIYKVLYPGQQAVQQSSRLLVNTVSTEDEVAWKLGKFVFDGMDIEAIMRMISRWYSVQITVDNSLKEMTFGGTVSRERPLAEILNALEATGKVHFKWQDPFILGTAERRIIAMP